MYRADWDSFADGVKEAAIGWQALLDSGQATDAEYAAFAAWIAVDASHANAYAIAEDVSGRIEAIGLNHPNAFEHLLENPPVIEPVRGRSWGIAHGYAIAASIAAMFVVTTVFLTQRPDTGGETTHVTADAMQFQSVILSDGTKITLAPGAALHAVFNPRRRNIESITGVAYFDVETDAARPFTVTLGENTVTVVGTEFEIKSFNGNQSVAVAEGVVTVQNEMVEPDTAPVRLTAGDRLTMSDNAPDGKLDRLAPSDIGAWRAGYFQFDDADVAEIISALNDFYGRALFVLDGDFDNIRFDGILLLADPQGTARRLSELVPVGVAEHDGVYRISQKNPSE